MGTNEAMITGRCECGEIRFEADGDIEEFSHCHCSQCRRVHGAAFATFATVATESFRLIAGERSAREYQSSPNNFRTFCAICGSSLFMRGTEYPDEVYLSMGAVDGAPKLPKAFHIYVASKAPWHDITDDAPQFDTEPTSIQ